MPKSFPVAAITDEFAPDFATALDAMAEIGMTGAELRVLFGRNVADLSDEDVRRAMEMVRQRGMEVVSIASPLLKCVLPDGPPVDERLQQDAFASRHTFEDQPRLADRILEIAQRTGARVIRVFSFWRTVRPEACFQAIVDSLGTLAEKAAPLGIVIGVENEFACNVATGEETARLLAAIDHPNLKVIWDPANAVVAGETPYPDGYRRLPPGRIAHVHAKDCTVEGHTPTWTRIGDGVVGWNGQVDALARDGYDGWLSLETHWSGPGGNKLEASRICGRVLQTLAARRARP